MLTNLNPQTFKDFGDILHKDFYDVCNNSCSLLIEEQTLTNRKVETFNQIKNSNVILDILDGLVVLYIASYKDNSIKTFLLDKPVEIKPNIKFGLSTLYNPSKIIFAVESEYENMQTKYNDNNLNINLYPKVKINKVYTLFYQEKEFGFCFKGEKHNFWELTYVDKGTLHTKVNDIEYILNQGDLIFYSCNQFHTQWSDKNKSTSFLTITFDMDFKNDMHLNNKVFSLENTLKLILKNILNEKESYNYYSDDLILCYLKELIIRLVRRENFEDTINNLNTDIQENIENSIVKTTLEYIHKNINTKITVPHIAQSIPISPSYLSTIFKKYMKTTIVEYMNSYKLEKSKDLIKTTNYNITEISNMLGYNSVHYFSRQFKNAYGISPSYYSKSIKK